MSEAFNLFDEEEVEEVETEKEAKKPTKEKKSKQASEEKVYRFPFGMYIDGELKEIDHIFEEEKEYSAAEITKVMLEHKFYEFAGNVTYDHIEVDNVLVPVFQQHKKG